MRDTLFHFDAIHLLFAGPGLGLALGAQAWMLAEIHAQSKVALRSGLRGADIAGIVLRSRGLAGVRLVGSQEWLGDYYDPATRTLHLSRETYQGRSVAAAGIAAHEAAHAIQHAEGGRPVVLHQKLAQGADAGMQFGVLLVIFGLAMAALDAMKAGTLVFSALVLFTLIKLSVEADASRRARGALARSGLLSGDELEGVQRVLRGSAATYAAAVLIAVLELLYFVIRIRS